MWIIGFFFSYFKIIISQQPSWVLKWPVWALECSNPKILLFACTSWLKHYFEQSRSLTTFLNPFYVLMQFLYCHNPTSNSKPHTYLFFLNNHYNIALSDQKKKKNYNIALKSISPLEILNIVPVLIWSKFVNLTS